MPKCSPRAASKRRMKLAWTLAKRRMKSVLGAVGVVSMANLEALVDRSSICRNIQQGGPAFQLAASTPVTGGERQSPPRGVDVKKPGAGPVFVSVAELSAATARTMGRSGTPAGAAGGAARLGRTATAADLDDLATTTTATAARTAAAAGAAAAAIAVTGIATAQLDGLGTGRRIRLEAGDDLAGQGLLDELFNVFQHVVLVHADQRDRFARRAGAAGAADTVDIVFWNVRQVVVDHVGQLVDVDAARGDVGGDQHLQGAVLEFRQGLGAGRLALVAVDRHRADAVRAQLLHQFIGAMLGAGKYQHLGPVVRLDQMGQHGVLLVAVDRVDLL